MPAFEVLGPLQISLGRMIGDITRFLVLFTLVRIIKSHKINDHVNDVMYYCIICTFKNLYQQECLICLY